MQTQKNFSVWVLGFCLSIVFALILGLLVVWLNIEQVDMAYNLKKMRQQVDQSRNLTAKLEVERDNLISPYRLSKEAERMGMRPAESGQQRKIIE
ncbi:MAG: hypothetical protein IJD04_02045 [Desulfovibrionaceae bacterium]|nr:hypothetical protein [Desulfovibrionaceae bacterium]